jgi:1-acyl-sn-glycerol-3-phosphate acyltransferase
VLRGLAILILLPVNLVLWGTPVLAGGIVKLLTFGTLRHRVNRALPRLGDRWAAFNDRIFDLFLDTRWDIQGVDGLRPDGQYLIVSNHVSWTDIFVLLRAFRGHTAFIRFFLKHTLIWFPILGQACWALGFPFMRRYSPEYLAQHPEKRGRDLETTRVACRRYRKIPVAILNFLEGTRFSREKHEDQESPYRYLLRPRVGGIGFVLASLAEQLDAICDTTIVYPSQDLTLWDFITNRVPKVTVRVRRLDVPPEFGDAAITEPGPAREDFRRWVEGIWREKDALIATLAPT